MKGTKGCLFFNASSFATALRPTHAPTTCTPPPPPPPPKKVIHHIPKILNICQYASVCECLGGGGVGLGGTRSVPECYSHAVTIIYQQKIQVTCACATAMCTKGTEYKNHTLICFYSFNLKSGLQVTTNVYYSYMGFSH